MQEAIEFWLRFLAAHKPRFIPVFYEERDVTVSYSDGEGAKAGLGLAVWSSRCGETPFAAYCEIPEEIRQLWDKQREAEQEHRDIFLIEAIVSAQDVSAHREEHDLVALHRQRGCPAQPQ